MIIAAAESKVYIIITHSIDVPRSIFFPAKLWAAIPSEERVVKQRYEVSIAASEESARSASKR